MEWKNISGVVFDEFFQTFFGFLLIRGDGAHFVVASAAEESCKDFSLDVIWKTLRDFYEGLVGAVWSVLDVFYEAVGQAALEVCAFVGSDQFDEAFGCSDAVRVGFQRWCEHGHDEAPVGHEAFGICDEGVMEVAHGFQFPTAMEVVDSLDCMRLCFFVVGGDGELQTIGEGTECGCLEVCEKRWDTVLDGGQFFRIGGWVFVRLSWE